jgi:hypothetical protein
VIKLNIHMMKLTMLLTFVLHFVTSFSYAQNLENVDFVSPIHENRIAVNKGNQWAFMDSDGDIVINYRTDLVLTNTENGHYPLFINGRCLIMKKKDDISYFGYIDTDGKTIIEPQFLNATNFQNDMAIVLLLKRTDINRNTALKKPVVTYDYFPVIIDLSGNVIMYMSTEPTHVILSSNYLRKLPVIEAKFISKTLIAVMNSQKKWSVININD